VREGEERQVDGGDGVEVVGGERTVRVGQLGMHVAQHSPRLAVGAEIHQSIPSMGVDEPDHFTTCVPGCTEHGHRMTQTVLLGKPPVYAYAHRYRYFDRAGPSPPRRKGPK
jgi:hypothetical protein